VLNSILNNCTLSNNQADFNGGGASGCTDDKFHADRQLRVVRRRRRAAGGTLVNCVLRGNEGYGEGWRRLLERHADQTARS